MSEPTPPPPPPGGPSPYAAYPPPPPGAPPPPPWTSPAPGPDHTLRTVLIVVGVVVLVLGGLLAWFVTSVINAADRIGDEFDTDYVGSDSRPLTVDEGDAFSIRGFDYASGWSIDTDGSTPASGLRATNDRTDRESGRADLRITLLAGDEIVEQFTCYADATITYGRSAALDCGYSGDPIPAFDTIEVNATALFP